MVGITHVINKAALKAHQNKTQRLKTTHFIEELFKGTKKGQYGFTRIGP